MRSGYFSRKLNLLTLDLVLSKTTHNCNSKEYIEYHIDDKESLKRIEGRYYKLKRNGAFLRTVKYNSKELIGQTIYMRSPIKCQCKDGICHVCYGELAKTNISINVGMLGATIMSSQFTQNILSAKHLSKTDSVEILMSKRFNDFFALDENRIYYNRDDDKYDNCYIMINAEELKAEVDDYYDDEEEGGEKQINVTDELFCKNIVIVDSNRNKIAVITEKNDMRMNITEYMHNLITRHTRNRKFAMVPMSDLENNEPLFYIDVINNELTKTLNLTKDLIETEDHLGCETVEELVYKFNRLLIEGKIDCQLVHAELIIKNLVRSVNDITQLPNYKKGEEYKILTVKQALMKHPSPLVSLSFEKVNNQLKSVLTFKKHKSSMLDKLFMEMYRETYQLSDKDVNQIENGEVEYIC